MKIVAFILFPLLLFGQTVNQKSDFKEKVDSAYMNAMKGVYYALENIPERKGSTSKDLIAENELIASVKVKKEVGGVVVKSSGFYNTYKVTVEVYRDYKTLKNEGIIKYIPKDE
ncbi:MAG: hypothetical protein PF445_05995 [Melioribacteraceae bacterium]|jgi:hypothetical protein|nr:hypothetical protein [Melioribacteraceae bacterium]